jgi:hypothetical protein
LISCSDVGGNERVKAEFFHGDTELRQFTFVGLDHVRMGFTDLLKFSLDFSNGVILEVLDLLEGRPNHAEGLRINARGSQDLVDLGILRLERLLDGLKLTLKHEVAKASLLVELVDELVERVEQLHLLFLEVLVLLELNFVLPLIFLVL